MRFAYLILAHAAPEQLRALVERLLADDPDDFAVVHIDGKSALWRETRGEFLRGLPRVTVIELPARVRWGHASQLEATRKLMRAALDQPFDMAHLLSGADWPLRPRAEIATEIAALDPPLCHIEAVPDIQSERMDWFRLDSRVLRPDPGKPLEWYPARALRKVSALFGQNRSHPWGPWHKGSQWWSLPRDACAHVLGQLDRGFASRRFAGTLCSDEHAIQTMIAHAMPDRMAPCRRFILWREGAASPETLTAQHIDELAACPDWFGRKFDRADDDFFVTRLPIGAKVE